MAEMLDWEESQREEEKIKEREFLRKNTLCRRLRKISVLFIVLSGILGFIFAAIIKSYGGSAILSIGTKYYLSKNEELIEIPHSLYLMNNLFIGLIILFLLLWVVLELIIYRIKRRQIRVKNEEKTF